MILLSKRDCAPGRAMSLSIQAWNLPLITYSPDNRTVQIPGGAPGYRNASMWLSLFLGSSLRW